MQVLLFKKTVNSSIKRGTVVKTYLILNENNDRELLNSLTPGHHI
jgi:hypothetical protein